MDAVTAWEATDVALVVLDVLAPAILLVAIALLRVYNVRLWLWLDKNNHHESQED